MITSKHKRMDLTQAINAYIWDNSSRGKMFEGIFDFQEVSSYIEKHIKNRINLGVKKFIDEMFKLNEEKLDIYIDIIHEETEEEKIKIIAAIKNRLTNAFYGLFGEHVLSNMISNSNKYRVKNLTAQDDYKKAIDIKIEEVLTSKILYIQVKTINYLNNPKSWHINQLAKEKRVHAENNMEVNYFYYNHDFDDRYFISRNKVISFKGYGFGQVNNLEIRIDRLMKLYGVKPEQSTGKITPETIIF